MTEHEWLTSESAAEMLLFKLDPRGLFRKLNVGDFAGFRFETNDYALCKIETIPEFIHLLEGLQAVYDTSSVHQGEILGKALVKGKPQADVVREIFGNIYRPVKYFNLENLEKMVWEPYSSLEPIQYTIGHEPRMAEPIYLSRKLLLWNDGLLWKAATKIYEENRFDELPILGDMLEEAGVCHDGILNHCRNVPLKVNTGPGDYGDEWVTIPAGLHIRGCWVVELFRRRNERFGFRN